VVGLGLQGKDLTRIKPFLSQILARKGFTENVRQLLKIPWVVDSHRKIV
jgi:hypothetical protein